MKRRDFFKNLGYLGILSQLPRIKTPLKPQTIPGYTTYYVPHHNDFHHVSSATAMSGSFSDVYGTAVIRSTRAMARKIEANLFKP